MGNIESQELSDQVLQRTLVEDIQVKPLTTETILLFVIKLTRECLGIFVFSRLYNIQKRTY